MAGLRPKLLVTPWQKELIAAQLGEEYVAAVCALVEYPPERVDEHCDCRAIPWPDHWHRRRL